MTTTSRPELSGPNSADLRIREEPLHVHLAGEIDACNAGEFRAALQRARPEPGDARALSVDLLEVGYLDSAGVALYEAAARGPVHIVVRTDSLVQRVVQISGLSTVTRVLDLAV